MLKVFVYLTGLAASVFIGKVAVDLAADNGSTSNVQIITFIFSVMFSMVVTILVVEADEKQTGFLFRFYRGLGKRLKWTIYVTEVVAQGFCIAFKWDVSDYLQVFVDGEKIAEWHTQGRVPREVLKLGLTEADFDAAIKGSTIIHHFEDHYVELMPVGYSYRPRFKAQT